MKNNANKSYLKKLSIHDEQPQRLGIRGWLRRLFGLRNEADIRGTIEELIEQEETGEIPASKDELVLLRNILNLHGLTVYDIMIPRADIVAVDLGTSLTDLVRIMSEEAHSRIPVYRETLDDIAGMVHIKDLLACWNSESKVILSDIVRSVLFVAPSMPILELLLQMRVSRLHLALVVDEFGGIDGMVTIEDLVEEIVGEIEDEHDEDYTPRMIERSDGTLEADARVPIKDFEDRLGEFLSIEEREEDIDTLGGLVFFLAGRVPSRGEMIPHASGFDFEVLDADPRRIRRIRICQPINNKNN
ncbi:MAG: magnesium/cobalt efflux protein [Rhodospirillaceae bacterium]|nr:magnesium/cobalt efflux protein [Rhodospirillaceae bacterium]|tara:strand:+ start:2027 stop:2932 length:906 start_codon:yes stop_codon:yes gene_type:complete